MVGSTGEAGSSAQDFAAGADASTPSSCLLGVVILLFFCSSYIIHCYLQWLSVVETLEEKKTMTDS